MPKFTKKILSKIAGKSAQTAKHTGESIKIPGLEPTFRHLDDPEVPWQHVRTQQNADGTTSSVYEKWFTFSPDPMYLSLYARYEPGMIVRRHGHYCPHIVFVLEGEVWCGDRLCPAGTHIELPYGAAFGPFRAGENGCVLYECMLGDPRSWGDQPETYEQLLAEHGVTRLPDPEIEMPDWLEDLRDRWPGAAAESAAEDDSASASDGAADGDTNPPKKPFKTPPMWLIPKISKTHVALYKLTSGKIGSDLAGKPGLLLRTVGRRSGKTHTVCLPYLPDGDSKVIVASFAGADRNPAWFHNLKANPDVVIRDKGEVYWAKAEVVGDEDRPDLWDKVVEDSPWYGEYQTKTTRQIPLVRLHYSRPYSK